MLKNINYPKALLGLGLAIFIFLNAGFIFSDSIWSDEAAYGLNVLQLRTDPASFFCVDCWAHGLPVLQAIAALLPFEPIVGLRVLNVLFGFFGILAVYYLGKEHFSLEVGGVSALILSTMSPYNYYAHRGLLDIPIATMFTIIALILLDKKIENKVKVPLLLGALIFTVFLKEIGAFLILIVCTYYLIYSKKKIFPAIGILSFFVISAYLVFGGRYNITLRIPEISQLIHLNNAIFTLVFLVPFLLGISYLIKKRSSQATYLLLWIGYLGGFLLFARFWLRMFIPIFPAVAIVVGIGLHRLYKIINASKFPKAIYAFSLLFFLLIVSLTLVQLTNFNKNSLNCTNFDLAENWVIDNVAPDSNIFVLADSQLDYLILATRRENKYQLNKLPMNYIEFADNSKQVFVVIDDCEGWHNIKINYNYAKDYYIARGFEVRYEHISFPKGESKILILEKKGG